MVNGGLPDSDPATESRLRLSPEEARDLAAEVVSSLGYAPDDAARIVGHVMDAAFCGYEYSGLPKLLDLAGHRKAKLDRRDPQIVHQTGVSALWDGGNTVGMVAVDIATDDLIARAQAEGFAVAGVYNSWMTGRSSYFAERIARAGLIALHTVSSFRIVAPPGATRPAIGTNPICFGFPTAGDPLLIDLGTSAFMMSELALVERQGDLLPEGVAIDSEGRPTRQPSAVHGGALRHFAGYRGFAIGLAMQAFGVMAGACRSPDRDYGYLLLAMRPDLLIPLEEYRRDLSETLARIKETPKQEGVTAIRLPSERAMQSRRELSVEGIEIDSRIHELLLKLCR